MPEPLPADLLTADEHQAMQLTSQLANLLSRIVGPGPSRPGDMGEVVMRIHAVQQMVLAQAAARAYPDRYRLLGETTQDAPNGAVSVPVAGLFGLEDHPASVDKGAATAPQTAPSAPPVLRHVPHTDDGVTYCGWDGVDGCGELWPCSTERARAASEPTPADPGPVRETTEAQDGVRRTPWLLLEDGLAERGIIPAEFTARPGTHGAVVAALAEIDRLRSARTAGDEPKPAGEGAALIAATEQEIDDARALDATTEASERLAWAETARILARTLDERLAGDEHLQALRDERDKIATELDIALDPDTDLPQIVANHVASLRQSWREHKALSERYRTLIEEVAEALGASAPDVATREDVIEGARDMYSTAVEARREAERLRGAANKISEWIQARVVDPATPILVADALRALAGSSDTTAGTGGSNND